MVSQHTLLTQSFANSRLTHYAITYILMEHRVPMAIWCLILAAYSGMAI